jgi:hypothetical protein
VGRACSACGGERVTYRVRVWWESLTGRDQLGDSSIDGRIILKWIFRKRGRAWTGLIWKRVGASGGIL